MKSKNLLMKILLMCLLSFTGIAMNRANGQNEVKAQVIKYLITNKDLGANQKPDDYTGSFYIVDLINNKDYNTSIKRGVFRFGAFGDHAKMYILTLNNKQIQILDTSNLENCLSEIMRFIREAKISSNLGLKYIENILWIYKKISNSTPWKT
jgi:hypothetical protein